MYIKLHALGFSNLPDFSYVNITDFLQHNSMSRLEYNLANLWAWNNVIDSDGPCVAITWSDDHATH